MKKLMLKASAFLALVVATMVGYANSVKAAADTDLVAGLASTTAIFTDNKSTIIGYVVAIMLVIIVIGLVIRSLFFGKRQILGVFGGGKRRR